MLQFESSISAPEGYETPALWFIFRGKRLLVQEEKINGRQALYVPRITHPVDHGLTVDRVHFLGLLDEVPCFVGEVGEENPLPEGWESRGLRRLLGQLPDDVLRVAGRGIHILDWDRNHQYCGRCGTPTNLSNDWAKVCPSCGLRAYPRISPAVIMAVTRGDQLLLAHAKRHPEGFYSVLAGFAEPGESLEEAVVREVREEVGLEIKNIRYFGSQPWPFPDSLMIGFTCEYETGEIRLVDSELDDAGWYRPGEFPGMTPPAEISIAGQLIKWFTDTVVSN